MSRHICSISCELKISSTNGGGSSSSCKNGQVSLGRNAKREIIVQLTLNGKRGASYLLTECSVHSKQSMQGRGSIVVTPRNLLIEMSNSPPHSLNVLLKTLSAKLKLAKRAVKNDENALVTQHTLNKKYLKAHEGPSMMTELSPLTLAEMRAIDPSIMDASPRVTPNGLTPRRTNAMAPRRRPTTSTIRLSREQNAVVADILQGTSIFFTGAAGTGKTVLLQHVIARLPASTTVVTATTGVAACHIHGLTLHSWAGVGVDAPIEQAIQLAMRPQFASAWRRCTHLVIDECSMMEADMFTTLETVARAVRGNTHPFGGIQLVLCGDFLQLPPVAKDNSPRRYCFQSPAWSRAIDKSTVLRQVHRQSDSAFVEILNELRLGRCSASSLAVLMATKGNEMGGAVTRLCTHTSEARAVNEKRLQALDAPLVVLRSSDGEPLTTGERKTVNAAVPAVLHVKLGALVLLTRNVEVGRGLCNGARGEIVSFSTLGHPVVRFECGETPTVIPVKQHVRLANARTVTRTQTPLRLAWAISIHKSQSGQAYVALSRCRSLEGLQVLHVDQRAIQADATVLTFYANL